MSDKVKEILGDFLARLNSIEKDVKSALGSSVIDGLTMAGALNSRLQVIHLLALIQALIRLRVWEWKCEEEGLETKQSELDGIFRVARDAGFNVKVVDGRLDLDIGIPDDKSLPVPPGLSEDLTKSLQLLVDGKVRVRNCLDIHASPDSAKIAQWLQELDSVEAS